MYELLQSTSKKNLGQTETTSHVSNLLNMFETKYYIAGLYMLWLFMLEVIFKRTVRPRFVEILWCHCHVQCQICFGLGDGQDTEEFSNIGVSLGCCHYFYTKVCSRMTSGGDLYHAETSKLISVANR